MTRIPLIVHCFLLLLPAFVVAQPDTEIYVFDLHKEANDYSIAELFNITYQKPGYDNQPHFLPDGSMYYVSTRNGQTDIAQVEFREYSWSWLTRTKQGSEYSPTPMPDSQDFSAIRLDTTGLQLLYRYPYNQSEPQVLMDDLKVGYHCWFNDNILVAFVLGDPATLQVCKLDQEQCSITDRDIGRSLSKIPNTALVSYISKEADQWQIRSLDPLTGATQTIINTLEGSEDLSWAPDGTIFMGRNDTLYKYNAVTDQDWVEVADLSEYNLSGITRLAVNAEGNKIAIVVNE